MHGTRRWGPVQRRQRGASVVAAVGVHVLVIAAVLFAPRGPREETVEPDRPVIVFTPPRPPAPRGDGAPARPARTRPSRDRIARVEPPPTRSPPREVDPLVEDRAAEAPVVDAPLEESAGGGVDGTIEGVPGGDVNGDGDAVHGDGMGPGPAGTGGPLPDGAGASDPSEPIRIGAHVERPVLVRRVEPEIRGVARRFAGTVRIECVIDEEGRVEVRRVLEGNPVLVPPCVEAVEQWRYSPARAHGRPQAVLMVVTVRIAS